MADEQKRSENLCTNDKSNHARTHANTSEMLAKTCSSTRYRINTRITKIKSKK